MARVAASVALNVPALNILKKKSKIVHTDQIKRNKERRRPFKQGDSENKLESTLNNNNNGNVLLGLQCKKIEYLTFRPGSLWGRTEASQRVEGYVICMPRLC